MTVSPQPDSPVKSEVVVRGYVEADYGACRSLWAELTEYHRGIYGDPSIGGDDPGAGFDEYLTTPERVGSWVAESDSEVVGLTGLLDRGTSGEAEPIVVAEALRNLGGHIDLTMDLGPRRHEWLSGASLRNLDFGY